MGLGIWTHIMHTLRWWLFPGSLSASPTAHSSIWAPKQTPKETPACTYLYGHIQRQRGVWTHWKAEEEIGNKVEKVTKNLLGKKPTCWVAVSDDVKPWASCDSQHKENPRGICSHSVTCHLISFHILWNMGFLALTRTSYSAQVQPIKLPPSQEHTYCFLTHHL